MPARPIAVPFTGLAELVEALHFLQRREKRAGLRQAQASRGRIKRSEPGAGFTLVEMLMALAVFSLAALALLRLSGATAVTTARLGDQALAQIVARNIAVETISDPVAPPLGTTAGQAVNGGRPWLWTRTVALSPEPRIQLVTVAVTSANGPERATLAVFRRAS